MRPASNTSAVAVTLVVVGVSLAVWLRPTGVASQSSAVRVALVNVPEDVLRPLLPDFQKQTGRSVEIVYTGVDPFAVAREGKADLVISHYGHEAAEPFVTEGFGLWPHPVFANVMALLGPPSDPAHVRGLTDAAEAIRRIAQTKSRFMVNNTAGAKYVEAILWRSTDLSSTGDWYVDLKLEGPQAVRAAAERGAYILWGLPPFLRLKQQSQLDLEPLVLDPLFQRIMVSIVVNPKNVSGVDVEAAKALETYLLAPATQARIRAFRYPNFDQQAWWPAGRHNNARE